MVENGKTGVGAAPVIGPSISESTRIRKGKNVARRADFGFAPIFTGEVFFVSKVLRQ